MAALLHLLILARWKEKVKFSRDYLHLLTTNSTNRILIQ